VFVFVFRRQALYHLKIGARHKVSQDAALYCFYFLIYNFIFDAQKRFLEELREQDMTIKYPNGGSAGG